MVNLEDFIPPAPIIGDLETGMFLYLSGRIFKKVGSLEREGYIMDGDQNLAVFDENGSLKYWNIFGNGLAGRLDASGDKFYYIKDHLGSTRAVIDNSGTVVEAHDYYPFGLRMPSRSYQTAERTKELFTGKELDGETGWYYHGARFRHPALGPWLSVDPLASKYPSWSPYVYTLNNPANHIDPNGLWTDPINKPTYRGWYVSKGNKLWAPEKSKFGEGVRGGGKRSHQGVDLTAKVGTKVKAVETGKIVKVYDSKSFGKTIMLEFKDKDGNTRYAQYSHLSKASVKEGEEVKEGSIIGEAGKSGNAKDLTEDEEHLHFGISTTKSPQAGIKTYEDPEKYMEIETPEKPEEKEEEDKNK